MACLSKASYTNKERMNRSQFVYKPCISFTNLASGVQNWRFVYKYSLFNFKTSISDYKLASRITTQPARPARPVPMAADIRYMPGCDPYIIHIITIFTGARIDGIPGSVIIRISKGCERIVKRIQTIIDHRK